LPASPAPESKSYAIDDDGWLHGPKVSHVESERVYSFLDTPAGEPIAVVWHWTAIPTAPDVLARRIVKAPASGGSSWHFCIGKDGSIVQSASCYKGTWHCAAGKINGKRTNRCSIGVEMQNLGVVKEIDGVFYGGRDKAGKWTYDKLGPVAKDVTPYGKKHYDTWTEAQIEAAAGLLEALKEAFPITKKNAAWGHVDLDPARREDPGPIWAKQILPKINK